MSTTSTTAVVQSNGSAVLDEPAFKFNRNYDDYEQVRPFYAEYSAVRAELDAAGMFPYNDRFTGRIKSLVNAEPKDESTAIYLLQGMHARDAIAVKVAEFLASGGEHVESLDEGVALRGTVVSYGFYMGGTGWQQWEDARLYRDARGFFVLPKGKRTNGHRLEGRTMILRGAKA